MTQRQREVIEIVLLSIIGGCCGVIVGILAFTLWGWM